MERLNIQVQGPMKNNILYFNDDVDLGTVSSFNKEYIDTCRTIISDTYTAEDNINRIIKEYQFANAGIDTTEDLKVSLPMPSIHIMLNSPGGSVYSGFSMYDTIKSYNKEVTTYIYVSGMCMSFGTTLLCSVPLEQRVAHPNTTFMIHQVAGFALGYVADMEQSVDEAKRLQDMIWDILLRNTNIPMEKLKEVYEKKLDWFITAEEAVKYGLIDRISEMPIIY